MIRSGTPEGIVVEWVLPTAAVAGLGLLAAGKGGRLVSLLSGDRAAVVTWVLTRAAYMILFWCILGTDLKDDMWAWERNTRGIAGGGVPGRDFFNLYGPLYPYLQFLGRYAMPGHHEVGTLWVFLVGDALAVFAGARVAAAALGAEAGVLVRAWLLLDPLLWHQLVVRAQDESLFLGTLCLAVLFVLRQRRVAGMAVLALGLCATKVTYGPYALAVLLAMAAAPPLPILPAVVFGGIVTAIYAAYLATGAPLFSSTNMETHQVNWGVGISATDALHRFLPGFPLRAGLAAYGLACAVVVPILCVRLRRLPPAPRIVLCLAAAHAVSLLTMPCCVSPYVGQGSAFAVLAVLLCAPAGRTRTGGLLLLALLGWLVVMYWTGSRVFSVPLKPVSIAANSLLLALLWRKGGEAPAP